MNPYHEPSMRIQWLVHTLENTQTKFRLSRSLLFHRNKTPATYVVLNILGFSLNRIRKSGALCIDRILFHPPYPKHQCFHVFHTPQASVTSSLTSFHWDLGGNISTASTPGHIHSHRRVSCLLSCIPHHPVKSCCVLFLSLLEPNTRELDLTPGQ